MQGLSPAHQQRDQKKNVESVRSPHQPNLKPEVLHSRYREGIFRESFGVCPLLLFGTPPSLAFWDASASPDATVATRVSQGSMILLNLLLMLHMRCGSLTRTHTLLVASPMKSPLSRRELFGCTKCQRYSNLTHAHPHHIVARRAVSKILKSSLWRPRRKRWYAHFFEPSPLRPLLDAIRRLPFVVAGVHMVGSGRRCACA